MCIWKKSLEIILDTLNSCNMTNWRVLVGIISYRTISLFVLLVTESGEF